MNANNPPRKNPAITRKSTPSERVKFGAFMVIVAAVVAFMVYAYYNPSLKVLGIPLELPFVLIIGAASLSFPLWFIGCVVADGLRRCGQR